MSLFGKTWKIDGLIAGSITRDARRNGRYVVVFEREFASLEQIETINWAAPTVECINPDIHNPEGLPVGYGFDVENINYYDGTKSYSVTLQVAAQYLGDVTGYQAQIDDLQATVAEKDATIEEQAAAIEKLKESGGAAELEAGLDAAYQEGVDSVE